MSWSGSPVADAQYRVFPNVKKAVRCVALSNLSSFTNIDPSADSATFDDVVIEELDRIAVINQTNGAENGIYVVGQPINGLVSLTRAPDANTSAKLVSGSYFNVLEGTVYAGKFFELTTDGTIVLGTTSLTFEQTFGDGANSVINDPDTDTSDRNIIQPQAVDIVPLTLKAAPGQTANLLEFKTSADTVVASVDEGGVLTLGGALPTIIGDGTTKYLVLKSAGTTIADSLVIVTPATGNTQYNSFYTQANSHATATDTRLGILNNAGTDAHITLRAQKSGGVTTNTLHFATGEAFKLVQNYTTEFLGVDTSGKLSITSNGTNQDIGINPSGTGTVLIGGTNPTIKSAGELYFDDTRTSAIPFSDISNSSLTSGSSILGAINTAYTLASSPTSAVILAPTNSTRNVIVPTGDYKNLVLKAQSGQTANILEVQDSSETRLASFSKDGYLYTGQILDSNGNEEIKFTTTASAVNELTIANAATGNAPTISATGGDTNIGLILSGKGTGAVTLNTLAISSTGVITSGTWQGSVISSTYLDLSGTVLKAPTSAESNTITIGTSNYYGLIVKAHASQSVNVFQVRNSSNAPKFSVGVSGDLRDLRSIWMTNDTNAVPFMITGASGQTVNMMLLSAYGGTPIFAVDASGNITYGVWNGTTIGATYGGTGQSSWTTGDLLYASASNTLSKLAAGTNGYVLTMSGGVPTWAASSAGVYAGSSETFSIAVTDELTPITTGTAKVTFKMPKNFTVRKVKASLTTAGSSTTSIDINKNGTTILNATTLDLASTVEVNSATTFSGGASTYSITEDDEITIDIDTAGTGAAGLKVYLIGTADINLDQFILAAQVFN